jgi:hypothetical protein
MKILVSLLLIFSAQLKADCGFKENIQKIYSLSGPVTMGLKSLGLLSKGQVKGISVFHPLTKLEFQGSFLPGGIFLSRSSLEQFSGSVLFYDQSQELSRIIKTISAVRGIEIRTRGLTPVEVTELVINQLRPHLSGCDEALANWHQNTLALEKKLLTLFPLPKNVVFFMGELKLKRFPETVIVNDGVVKWLNNKNVIHTYPSELAYINWSMKILSTLPKTTLQVGIIDTGREFKKEVNQLTNDPLKKNLYYPGALIPGDSQLHAMIYLFESLK